jgi:hypothetical protein
MSEKILENTFDKYFAPITFKNVTISWEEPGHMKVDIQAAGPYSFYYQSEQVGMGIEVPSTLLEATYAFKFKMNPQTRIKEVKTANLFWYGAGYRGNLGINSYPLFRTYLDASTNHVYLVFDGKIWVPGVGTLNIWPFGTWSVDLGDESNFKDWSWVIIHIDVQNKCFKKIIIGGVEIPKPPGYDVFKPDWKGIGEIYPSINITKGIFVGKLFGDASTNAQFLIDDVQIWTGYYVPTPPPPPPPPPSAKPFPWWLLAIIFGGTISEYAMHEKEKRRT